MHDSLIVICDITNVSSREELFKLKTNKPEFVAEEIFNWAVFLKENREICSEFVSKCMYHLRCEGSSRGGKNTYLYFHFDTPWVYMLLSLGHHQKEY